MRLVVVAGMRGSGKTSLIRAASDFIGAEISFIANNPESEDLMRDRCAYTDNFPFKSPCARIRQFRYRYDLMKEKDPQLLICEPPGNCMEESSPMVNPIYVTDRKAVSIGPLITVVRPDDLRKGLNGKTVEGLRLRNMADESDIIAVSSSEGVSDNERARLACEVGLVNPDADVIFFSVSTGENIRRIAGIMESKGDYTRPLFN